MRRRIRTFLALEAATFVLASLIHAGLVLPGYEHREAHLAEAAIATALLAGLAATWIRPAWTRGAGLVSQAFALLGTLVGLFTIAVGVGPRTAPDVAYHVAIIGVLTWGLLYAPRSRGPSRRGTSR